jgi:acyl-CoA thioesterase
MDETELRPTEGYSNPFGDLIGLRFVEWRDGQSICRVEVVPALMNPNGVLHGAVMYALADTGMGGALISVLDEGQLCTTVEIKISYFRPVTAGALTCTSGVIHRGRRIAFLEASVFQEDKLTAQATGTFAIRSA